MCYKMSGLSEAEYSKLGVLPNTSKGPVNGRPVMDKPRGFTLIELLVVIAITDI